MSAARNGKTKSAALLIKAGCDVNAALNICVLAALMLAAQGNTENALPTIHLLLKAGAEINYTDKEGCTALMWAARAGRSEAVRLLISAGADVFIRAHKRPVRSCLETETTARNALDLAKDDAVKDILKSEMHRRIAAALSVLPLMPVDVRQKIIQLYLDY